jgi:carboxyl-terminal processing protease
MKFTHFIKYITLGTALTVCTSYMPPVELDKSTVLLRVLVEGLTAGHYEEHTINDDFSKKIYQLYLKNLDNNKQFLTQEDLKTLLPFEQSIDDELKEGTYSFFEASYSLITKKTKEVSGYYKGILAQPFDFTKSESYERDDEKLAFARNEAELKEQWRLRLKYSTLAMLVSSIESEEKKAKDSANYKPKTKEVLETEARKKVEKSYTEWFDNLSKLERADRWSAYINSITGAYDPHTTYYSPSNKQNFDIEMTGQFEGIGATLQEREGTVSVADIMPGSASWRQGELKKGDLILKVAQEGKDAVDVTNMRLDKVVQQIRGKKGTKVILSVKKVDGSMADITIVRDVVVLEEKYAKSAIIENPNEKRKVGYINLPGFYADFNNKGSRSCAEDVKKELVKLQAENINSVVLDLRNNGGGSLQDVVNMMGLFIDKGPVVQVKSREGSPYILEDKDSRVIFDGNLVVLVNSFSASASEILAAAVQDYKRGIVMGSPTTFGKGTVQRIIDLDGFLPTEYQEVKPLGNLTLTLQKFYRVNGGATQLKGVTPDVVMNDVYSYLPLGEKDQDYPLKWDEIGALPVKGWLSDSQIAEIKKNSTQRIKKSEVFSLINQSAERAKKMREDSKISLKLENYRAELKEDREEAKQLEEVQKKTPEFNVSALQADETANNTSPESKEKANRFYKNLKKDVYLQEALNVLGEMQTNKMVAGGKAEENKK